MPAQMWQTQKLCLKLNAKQLLQISSTSKCCPLELHVAKWQVLCT